MRSDITRTAVDDALARVVDPCSIATGVPITLADMGLVKDVAINGDSVEITLRLTSPVCMQAGLIVDAVNRQVADIRGVNRVTCNVDAASEWLPTMLAPSARSKLRQVRPTERAV